MSTTFATRPTCSHCGGRITLFECLWRELPSGELCASYAVDLQGLQRAGQRLWHVGCPVPAAVRRPAQPVERRPLRLAA